MRCPVCDTEVTFALVVAEAGEAEGVDPLAPVVRRLEAEQYGSPEPLPRPPPIPRDGWE